MVEPEPPVATPFPEVFLLPDTAEDAIGVSERTSILRDGGGIDLVLDGWQVDRLEGETGTELSVTLFVTLVGAFAPDAGPSALSLFYEGAREDGVVPVIAERYLADSDLREPVEASRVDPLIWVPVAAGEERSLWFRWAIPEDTGRLLVSIANTITFAVFPHQVGEWGNTRPAVEDPPPVNPADENLFLSCFTLQECASMGIAANEQIALWFGFEWERGSVFEVTEQPDPITNEGMLLTDLTVWYESGPDVVWYPDGDPWGPWVRNGGTAMFNVNIPRLPEPLYVQWERPDGNAVVWKTVTMARDRLFDNPDWVWESEYPTWAERKAIAAADRVCWAHWTNSADPHGMFEEPVEVYYGEYVTITEGMIDWALEEVCRQ